MFDEKFNPQPEPPAIASFFDILVFIFRILLFLFRGRSMM
jgi:hypothetical protein